MNDRDLLELAAKAAGIVIDKTTTNGGGRGNTGFDALGNAVLDWHNGKTWNPLADDGDALRLAVKLGMQIDTRHPETRVYAPIYDVVCEYHKPDATAATRRAITRAAAEIVRQMP